jgi:CDP-diacylglycerol--glycerol-3-phosphate 3-phosphatidyltransferase
MANIITLSRFPLLLIFILMLYLGDSTIRLISVPLLFIALLFDTIDGMIARRKGEDSLVGSVLDIAADRVYELVLWVALADKGVIPISIPMIVITRTTLTDAIRSLGIREGTAPFEQHRSKLGKFVVGSRWMRFIYGVAKILAFIGLTLGVALTGVSDDAAADILPVFLVVAWIAVALCVIRGLPVIGGTIRNSLETSKAES